MESKSRRKFLGACLTGAAVVAAGAVIWPIFEFLRPRSGQTGTEKVTFAINDIPEGEAKFFEYAGSSAVIIKTKGNFIALSAVCTHMGCIVQWEKDKQDFLCPCHGGRFAPDGTVLGGPPPKPLPKLPMQMVGDKIMVG
jgi:cytochrome b6-f complex iron-sulfur subunit